MIHTDGIRTIANAGPVPTKRRTRSPISRVMGPSTEPFVPFEAIDNASFDLDASLHPNRGPQVNGQDWNDDLCHCGQLVCDSPAGDKCWDCFNFDPSE